MNGVLALAAIIMLVLLFLKVPVYISVLGGAMVYFVMNPDVNAIVFAQQAITGAESISLLAIPFFVCAGVMMNYTGVTKRIMDFCEVLTGRMYGGLAQVNVLLSTLMGGLSGSNLADAAMEAKMLVPEMVKKGFSLEFSSVVTAVSAMITPLIPPGISMILYGCIANVSIGDLFLSGLGIGATMCIVMMIVVRFMSKNRGYAPLRTTRVSGKEWIAATKPAILPLCLPIIIIGGIRIGLFTATEAGAVAIIYAVLLGIIYREMRWGDLKQGLKETVCTTSSIMLIVAAACVFSWVLTKERIPQQLTEWIVATINNKYIYDLTNDDEAYSVSDIGVTLAHELGHFLGLYHAFNQLNNGNTNTSQDTDYCTDTPPYNKYQYDIRLTNYLTFNPAITSKSSEAYQTYVMRTNSQTGEEFRSTNIMDYAISDANSFSEQQKERVRYILQQHKITEWHRK